MVAAVEADLVVLVALVVMVVQDITLQDMKFMIQGTDIMYTNH
jgi:hypothetical protein